MALREPSPTQPYKPTVLAEQEAAEFEKESCPDASAIAEVKIATALSQFGQQEIKRKLLKSQVRKYKEDVRLRREHASKAYRFVWFWSVALILILLLAGSSSSPEVKFWFVEFKPAFFKLSDGVLITLISGVTVNIVAVFAIVIRNLLPSNIEMEKKDDEEKGKEPLEK